MSSAELPVACRCRGHLHDGDQQTLGMCVVCGCPSDAQPDTAARMSVMHDVKCWPVYFERVLDGSKTFEVRLNDRDYQQGDRIMLNEWDPETGHYTHRRVSAVIGYVLSEYCAAIPDFAGHVVFSLHKVRRHS